VPGKFPLRDLRERNRCRSSCPDATNSDEDLDRAEEKKKAVHHGQECAVVFSRGLGETLPEFPFELVDDGTQICRIKPELVVELAQDVALAAIELGSRGKGRNQARHSGRRDHLDGLRGCEGMIDEGETRSEADEGRHSVTLRLSQLFFSLDDEDRDPQCNATHYSLEISAAGSWLFSGKKPGRTKRRPGSTPPDVSIFLSCHLAMSLNYNKWYASEPSLSGNRFE
jgi:hypothetical protein